MTRSLPGTIEDNGREFVYVECQIGQDFSRLMDEVLSTCPNAPLPQSGGAIEEKARIILSDKTSFLAISYRGDLQGWKTKIVCYCHEKGRKWGILENDVLVTSDGRKVPLAECEVQFER